MFSSVHSKYGLGRVEKKMSLWTECWPPGIWNKLFSMLTNMSTNTNFLSGLCSTVMPFLMAWFARSASQSFLCYGGKCLYLVIAAEQAAVQSTAKSLLENLASRPQYFKKAGHHLTQVYLVWCIGLSFCQEILERISSAPCVFTACPVKTIWPVHPGCSANLGTWNA